MDATSPADLGDALAICDRCSSDAFDPDEMRNCKRCSSVVCPTCWDKGAQMCLDCRDDPGWIGKKFGAAGEGV